MRITPLASGSQGNSLLLESPGEQVLVDVGVPIDDLLGRLARVGADPQRTTAVLMTHRHRDHARGVADFCRRFDVPVHGTRRTLRSLCNKLHRRVRRFEPDGRFRLGGLDVRAVPLSHDAPETVGFRFADARFRFGLATDLGCAAGPIAEVFTDLDALLLEFNYDPDQLASGPYPPQLRDRVAGDRGHLGNDQAADLLRRLWSPRLAVLVLAHVSARNNTPALALAAARSALPAGSQIRIVVADQAAPSPALDLFELIGAGSCGTPPGPAGPAAHR